MSWPVVKLKDCCQSIADGDHQAPPKVDQGVPFITISNIIHNELDFTNTMFVPESYYNSIDNKRRAKKGDILYSVVGSFGIPVLITEDKKFSFQRHIAILRPNISIIDKYFLYYTMLCPDFYAMADAVAIGAAQRTISLNSLRNLEIKLPPLNIQKKIVNILSPYDALIKNNNKQIKLLEEAAQRLYKEWFIDLRFPGHESTKIVDGVPEGWTRTTLGNIIEIKYGKDHKSISDGDIPVYGSGGEISYCSQYLYDGESILIPRKGSLNNILYVNKKFWTVDTMFYSKILCPQSGIFTYFCLKSFDMYSMNIGAAVPSMTINILKNLKIILPNPNILKKFQAINKNYFQKIDILIYQKKKLLQSRDKLLGKMMNYSLITAD